MVLPKGFGRVLFLFQGAIIYKTHLHFKEHFRLTQLISFCTKLYQEVVQPIETENTTYTQKTKKLLNALLHPKKGGKQLNKNIIISTLHNLRPPHHQQARKTVIILTMLLQLVFHSKHFHQSFSKPMQL